MDGRGRGLTARAVRSPGGQAEFHGYLTNRSCGGNLRWSEWADTMSLSGTNPTPYPSGSALQAYFDLCEAKGMEDMLELEEMQKKHRRPSPRG